MSAPALLALMIPIVAILCVFATPVLIVWIVSRNRGNGGGRESAETLQMVQRFNQDLTRMEKRIESLETILLDRIEKKREQESGLLSIKKGGR